MNRIKEAQRAAFLARAHKALQLKDGCLTLNNSVVRGWIGRPTGNYAATS